MLKYQTTQTIPHEIFLFSTPRRDFFIECIVMNWLMVLINAAKRLNLIPNENGYQAFNSHHACQRYCPIQKYIEISAADTLFQYRYIDAQWLHFIFPCNSLFWSIKIRDGYIDNRSIKARILNSHINKIITYKKILIKFEQFFKKISKYF